MHPVPIPQATAGPLTVKVNLYLFSPVKAVSIQSSESCAFGISSVMPAPGLINALKTSLVRQNSCALSNIASH